MYRYYTIDKLSNISDGNIFTNKYLKYYTDNGVTREVSPRGIPNNNNNKA